MQKLFLHVGSSGWSLSTFMLKPVKQKLSQPVHCPAPPPVLQPIPGRPANVWQLLPIEVQYVHTLHANPFTGGWHVYGDACPYSCCGPQGVGMMPRDFQLPWFRCD